VALTVENNSVRNYLSTPDERSKYYGEYWDSITTHKLKVKIHKEYAFSAEGVRQSQVDITGGSTTGKLVIKF
jgi:NADPH2:quinone reductase